MTATNAPPAPPTAPATNRSDAPPAPPTMSGKQASAPAATTTPQFSMAVPKDVAPRLIVNGVEGWGKTTLAAFIPNVRLILAPGETGYETLLGTHPRLVPPVVNVTSQTWQELLAVLDALIADPGTCSMVALDALSGFEFLCYQYVCDREHDGEWGEKGFMAYQKGYEESAIVWRTLLVRLDELRQRHKIGSIFLSHIQVRNYRNPVGEDYDRFEADCHKKVWAPTHKWADAVLYGTYEAVVAEDRQGKSTHKGIGIGHRIMHTTYSDAHQAKNRYGMPSVIHMTGEPKDMWDIIHKLIKGDANAS